MSDGRLTTKDIAKAAEHTAAEPAPAQLLHEGDRTAMFGPDESSGFRTRWDAIQTGFVDEPRKAVQEADTLVAEVIKRLSEVFADERTTLEHQWERGDQISTEDLRVALKKYRSFFERLLSL